MTGNRNDTAIFWGARLSPLLDIIQNGNAEQRQSTLAELSEMAKAADAFQAIIEPQTIDVQHWLHGEGYASASVAILGQLPAMTARGAPLGGKLNGRKYIFVTSIEGGQHRTWFRHGPHAYCIETAKPLEQGTEMVYDLL